MSVLKIENVYKKEILFDINMEINSGEIVALVGPNGSGKSTLMKCIMGFSKVNEGEIRINDISLEDRKAYLSSVVCSIENPSLYPDLNAKEHFKLVSTLKQVDASRVEYYTRFSGLKDMRKKIKYYSVGMKKILILSLVLMQQPEFLILDEPFNGLDLQTKNKVMNELKRLNKEGTTILWSAHEITQLRELSDRFVFINKGKFVGELKNRNMNCHIEKDWLEDYYLEVCKDV